MTSKEFIIDKLNYIINKFPCVKCSYQFDKFIGLHSIEILPSAYLNSPHGFGELQFNITKEFICSFPDERLSFFTTGNIMELEASQLVCVVKGRYCVDTIKDVQLFPDNNLQIARVDFLIDKDANYALAA